MNKIVFHLLVLLMVASCSHESNENTDHKTRLENEIRGQVKFLNEPENLNSISNKMSELKIPALSLTIINQGQIEWSDVYQNPNFYTEEKLDNTSIFQAASLSKPVTFMAALRMHSAGEIDLDKNIQDYLKEFELPIGKQTEENPVTFRNIFSHTSGLNAGGYQGYSQELDLPSDMDILLGKEGVNSAAIEVVNTPNEALIYSGGGYTLAEVALQDRYNDDFAKIMKKWILDPAGMKSSDFIQPIPSTWSNRIAKGHTQSGNILEGGWRNYPEQAAAGLWSNSSDLAKFLIEIYNAYQGNNSILSTSDIKSIINQERDGHIYGFVTERNGDDISITHYGGNAGYRTSMTISLTSGNGLVYLINSDNGVSLGNELLLSASEIYGWKHFKQTQVHSDDVDLEILKGLAGEYKWNNQIDLTIGFNDDSNSISLIFPNGDDYILSPIVGDELDFIHSNTGVRVAFLKDNDLNSFSLYGNTAVKM